MKGKFIKPTLKKVSKYENKFAKLQEKAAKFAFANQLGELVLVLAHLFQGGLNELALHVGDGDGELVDLQIPEDHLALKEEHLPLEAVPLVEVGLADLLEIVNG